MNREFSNQTKNLLTQFSGSIKKAFGYRRIIAEIAVIPPLVLAWYQLHDIAQANKMTAEEYISTYEKEHLPKWDNIDPKLEEIRAQFVSKYGEITETNKAKLLRKLDRAIRKGIKEENLTSEIDRMAIHFRLVLFCMQDDGRCDEERVLRYYKPHICNFVQKTYGYLESKYSRKENAWDRKRGDLIAFNQEQECAKAESQKDETPARRLSGRNRSRNLSKLENTCDRSRRDMSGRCDTEEADDKQVARAERTIPV